MHHYYDIKDLTEKCNEKLQELGFYPIILHFSIDYKIDT